MVILRFAYFAATTIGLAVVLGQFFVPPLPLFVLVPASFAVLMMTFEIFFGQGKHSEPPTVRLIFSPLLLAVLIGAWVVWAV